MSAFTESDLQVLKDKGILIEKVRDQIDTFRNGIPFVNLEKAGVVGDGILKFSLDEEQHLIELFNKERNGLSLLKFVPASGAASRMFKALFNFLETYDSSEEQLESYFERTGDKDLKTFSEGLKEFPFYDIVQQRIAGQSKNKGEEVFLFVKELLSENALNYGFYPKGLLPFHNNSSFAASPFEEHLKEGALYSKTGKTALLHFTISEQHTDLFAEEFNSIKDRISLETDTTFNVGYSYQKSATDTIAVDMQNKPFRNIDGSLLFRPGGHGALIENLNEQDADIIFIKNIDNVVVPENLEGVSNSKKTLAGVLLQVQQKAFIYAKLLAAHTIGDAQRKEIKLFLEEELNIRFSNVFDTYSDEEQAKILKDKINRPIRICGMVKNEGEPGGGPFWIKDKTGNSSLQIIESAQIDASDSSQMDIVANATHFNPVDLVCGVRNYDGEKYDLLKFVDHKQGFITDKTKDGKELKALELPGLWNGGMAFWNTIFVEVPLLTFNPVKTVNDLLKASHQVK